MAKFPQDLTPMDKIMLVKVAVNYGFDPLMGEVSIYQGKPYVSIDGRYRKAQETGMLNGVESRPATKQEREEWEIPVGDYFFRAEVSVKGADKLFVGWGRVRGCETRPGSNKPGDTTSTYKPIQGNPQRMAEKRAEAQALRKAFHIDLPSIEDIGTEEATEPVGVKVIDVEPSTGEIVDKQASKANAITDKEPEQVKPEQPKEDLMTLELKNAGEFMQACLTHFNLQPSAVRAEVGEYDLNITKQRKEAWQKIIEPRIEK
jgi:hypothetical protein